jgi:hypothetical protein
MPKAAATPLLVISRPCPQMPGDAHPARPAQSPQTHRSAAVRRPVAGGSVDPRVTGRCCAQHESARNAGERPGCGTADGAARHIRGMQTGSPPVPAGRGCRRPACEAPALREAAPAPAAPVRTRNAGTRVRTHRSGSPAPTPALCRAAAARAAGRSMRSCIHGKAAVSPAGTARSPEAAAQNIQSGTGSARRWAIRSRLGAAVRHENGLHLIFGIALSLAGMLALRLRPGRCRCG